MGTNPYPVDQKLTPTRQGRVGVISNNNYNDSNNNNDDNNNNNL